MMIDEYRLLTLLVEQARGARLLTPAPIPPPEPGDLVIEITKFRYDPDAIGWLIGHGEAPYNEDGTGPVREIWDVVPLSGAKGKTKPYQRWENAQFAKVATQLEFPPPPDVAQLIANRAN